MKQVAILLIGFYQKYVSPYKGYRCAHAAVYGGESCSEAIKTIVFENGVLAGAPLIRPRFQACRDAYELYQTRKEEDEKDEKKTSDPCLVLDCIPALDCIPRGCSIGKYISSPRGGSGVDLPCDCGW